MSGFRVTNQMILDNVLTNFQANEQLLQEAEKKVSTGQAFSQPSDAPFDASQAVTFRQRIGLNSQLQQLHLDTTPLHCNRQAIELGREVAIQR